ncbi:phage regulatory CII family protein [Paraburkholderia caribensis]|uniref:phage regulatory CII family protein n=1 Tax=Paraburkholderia caribensis TaxID=75105 RepID=UPI0034D348D5
MNTADAAHAVAQDFPGGIKALAARMDANYDVLRNKLNPNPTPENRNVLTLKEAVRITDITNDDRILEAWARERGKVLVDLPDAENCADADVIEMMAQTWETNGDVGREVNAIFADGRVEQHEIPGLKNRALKHVRTVLGLVSRIAGMAER